jgi:hypothetical protein
VFLIHCDYVHADAPLYYVIHTYTACLVIVLLLNSSLFTAVPAVVWMTVAWYPSDDCRDINEYYWYACWNSGGIFWQLPAVKAQVYRHHTSNYNVVARITSVFLISLLHTQENRNDVLFGWKDLRHWGKIHYATWCTFGYRVHCCSAYHFAVWTGR